MKRLNQTESPIFVILYVLCFQRQSVFFTFISYAAFVLSLFVLSLFLISLSFGPRKTVLRDCSFTYISVLSFHAVLILFGAFEDITKTCLYNFDSLNPIFIGKTGFCRGIH